MRTEAVFCPICGDKMNRLYSRDTDTRTKKRYWQTEGWICSCGLCRHIIRD